jgi:uncharacterized protein YqkB
MQSLLLRVGNFIRVIPDEVFAYDSAKVSPHLVGEATIIEVFKLDFFLKPGKVGEFTNTHWSVKTTVNCCHSHGVDIHDFIKVDRCTDHNGSDVLIGESQKEFLHKNNTFKFNNESNNKVLLRK